MVESTISGSAAIKKADEQVKLAKSELKTGLFKWSANHVQAAIHYEKAAKLYKQAGDKVKAIEAYLEFSKCSEQSNELIGAAEGLNEAAFLTDDKKKQMGWLAEADAFYKIAG
jgi:tetratricopeptide (TPR) repeat protein